MSTSSSDDKVKELRELQRKQRKALEQTNRELASLQPPPKPGMKTWVGGSFAPPLDTDKLTRYRELADAAVSSQVREVLHKLCDMVEKFWETPSSSLSGVAHPSGRGLVVKLEDDEIKRIWDYVPYDKENKMYAELFDTIDAKTDKELRDAAFHLLWFAVELEKDREPLTNDML